MKKIIFSLLAVAATMNVMAVTYSAKATILLESQSSYESCQIILGQSDELSAGLNSGEYAEINMEGRSVALYVEYNGVKYQHFASNPATMKDLVLGAMTDAATTYNLTISNVSGTENFKLKIGDDEFDVVAGTKTITLAPNQTASIGFVNPVPVVPGICNNYDKLQITGYAGAQLEVLNYADKASVFAEKVTGDNAEIDLEAKGLTANTQYFVKLTPAGATAALEYVIKFKPAVTPVNP